ALTAVLGVVASARRGTRALPHGPSMCAATVLAVVWG
ncbi:MAG: prepilin peptidase, partial [Mycobacteriaceae bacterium]|nr:prepilin peptidase [Mycobacteriaceae bacterium]